MAPAARFAVFLAFALISLLALTKPKPYGDFLEYSITTVALAAHGSAAIRAADAVEAAALAPAHTDYFHALAEGMAAGRVTPQPGFNISRDGAFYSIHPWGYSALAAPFFVLFKAVGIDPLKSFQAVNVAAMFVLGLCLYRLFASAWRSALGLVLFMLCGGALYWNWCSPECMSAAALLGAMILLCTGAPLLGGLLGGLAAVQNPSIVLLAPLAPLLIIAFRYRIDCGWRSAAADIISWRLAWGLAILVTLFVVPFILSYWQFGVPSLIAKYSTSREFITLNRLHSLLFDLNQGMVVGAAAFMGIGLAALCRRSSAALAAVSLALVLVMAVPTLSAYNWNSGAEGMMRYAFWCAMPLLFVFLVMLQRAPRLPYWLLLAVLLVQGLSVYHASCYGYGALSPVARLVLETAPGWYNPDYEVFADRVEMADLARGPEHVVQFRAEPSREPTKTLYHRDRPGIGALLCAGKGGALAASNSVVELDGGWRYINGPIVCEATRGR